MKNSTFSHSSLASFQELSSIRQHHPALSFLEYNRSKPRKDADEIMFHWKKSRSYSIQEGLGSSPRLAMTPFARLSLYCKVFYGQTFAYAIRIGQPENPSHILYCFLSEKLDVAHWALVCCAHRTIKLRPTWEISCWLGFSQYFLLFASRLVTSLCQGGTMVFSFLLQGHQEKKKQERKKMESNKEGTKQ